VSRNWLLCLIIVLRLYTIADDILLLSPFITGLQNMLDKCSELAKLLSLEFNVEKSHCIAFGSMSNATTTPVSLCGNSVE